jgi:tripartite ATP-independent transporter DctM subunit
MFGAMLLCLLTGLPIVFILGSLGIIFAALLWGPQSLMMIVYGIYSLENSFIFLALPLFCFMGFILQTSGVADDLFEMAYRWMGGVRGGLAMGVVLICALFAAMVGLSGPATLAMGLIALPAMLKRNYDKELVLGTIQAGGALGILIPPSITFVIYAMVARESVGQLFASGVFPGLLLAAFYILYIGIRSYLQPKLAPALPLEERASWHGKLISLRGVVLPILIVILVLGSILLGITTPTEAAAGGCVGAIIAAGVRRTLGWGMLKDAMRRTLRITAMVCWLLIGATVFSAVYNALGAVGLIKDLLGAMQLGKMGILGLMLFSFLVLGCFLDDTAILFITMPIYLPLLESLGVDKVWFGCLVVLTTESAYLTPPFGMNLFYMKGIVPKGITMVDIYKSIVPFVCIQVVGLLIVLIFPQIALWLPTILFRRT